MNRRKSSTLALLAVGVLAAIVGLVFDAAHGLKATERATIDARFSIRGDQAPPKDVVLVAMDNRAVGHGKVPFDRRRHAKVIEQLTKAGAGVIAYDVQFTEASDSAAADEALYEAVSKAPRIVLGTTEVFPGGQTEIFGGDDALAQSGATPAASVIPVDTGGRLRRLQFKINDLDSFAVAAARIKLGRKTLLPAGHSAWIDYPGPVRRLSFADVESGHFPASAVRGKVVVVGATADAFGDFQRTPVSDRMPGAEVQAAAIDTVLRGFPLRDAAWWTDALLIIALAFVPPLIALRFGAIPAVLGGLVAIGAYLVAAQLAFDSGTIVTVVPPLAAAAVALALTPPVANPSRIPLGGVLQELGPPRANPRSRRLQAGSLLGSAVLIVASVLVLQATGVLQRTELSTVNERFDIRGSTGAPSNIVLVAIDDFTFTTPPKPTWPFPRSMHAKVIRNLTKAGAKVIAYDVQFTEASGDTEEAVRDDRELLDAVTAADGKVVLATTEVRPDGSTEIFSFAGDDALAKSKAVPAFSAYGKDADGKIRRIKASENGLISFDLATASLAVGHPIKAPSDDPWIDYFGPPETVKTLSFVDVERGQFNPADVRGKIVVVGSTSSVLQDFHATSTSHSDLMAGPEIHANAIDTVLRGFPLRDGPHWLNLAMVIVLGLLAPIAGLRLKPLPSAAVGVAGLVALLVGAQVAFQHGGAIIQVVYPFMAGFLALLATGVIHGLTTAFEREQARDAFARFVPEAVVDQVLADADGVRLGGVRREGTVMFSDLRGFTSFSETLEPERVIESLNRYLSEMSEAILDHGGTLVAYMGDGIMAVFGAPLQQDDHADRALEAARDMLSRMDGFNGWLREQELHDGFKMGIGLNSGPVMSGNVGSERRLEYTALGDTTNTAARLEGMTKGTPHQLFISDTTKQMLTRAADDLVQVGEAEVRGRKAKVVLWSIGEPAPAPAPTEHAEAS
ncbi:MAG TPA: adenylate/guanylate cyclase domain-containing protein [Solirubrobacter sp.]|nr:adenylate/guanylate cyclase domain-containing protein [Solirubrobacter sp.]